MGKYFQEEIETASREKIEQIQTEDFGRGKKSIRECTFLQKKNGGKRCNT